ncbi:hypothetical protein LX32DRAFT_645877 [Colletotrichum zoysiae]|uniref:CVNH domain-containing protein n=1 Tax=Colletotrichum zoysiae TaxID=1216348 RepID=A0AAD9H3Y9_9PEZI|nr:hypothetical protein LX32DRAFT_645877 [Colletotrichum zoysiae]
MKASSIQSLVVALVAGAGVAEACSSYRQCRCTMADGSINNSITELACSGLNENTRGAKGDNYEAYSIGNTDSVNASDTTTEWCNWGFGGKIAFFVDNCSFRDLCTGNGATGSDSWCQDKKE